MFVGVARVSLDIPSSGSHKAKRQVVKRITDRVKARFNTAIAEMEENDEYQRAVLALAVVTNDKQHCNEQLDKILHFIEEMYVAPVNGREIEILAFGDQLFADGESFMELAIPRGERTLAEAEGMGAWEERHAKPSAPTPHASSPRAAKKEKAALPLEQAKAKARALRNKREWER
ncbi:MAG: DUF503 domain-containing protein [Archangiaceae bacterium]|nr:DUF503 domain-containing protein [Archangiaceae bacterium]